MKGISNREMAPEWEVVISLPGREHEAEVVLDNLNEHMAKQCAQYNNSMNKFCVHKYGLTYKARVVS